MHPKDAEGTANSVDPDQTPLGAVWSGSALFAHTVCPETQDHYGINIYGTKGMQLACANMVFIKIT